MINKLCYFKFKPLFFLLLLICFQSVASETFRFHLLSEPQNLNPILNRGSSGSYLFNNIYRSLFRMDKNNELIPDGGKECNWMNPLKLKCELNPNAKWNNGESITSEHYLKTFRNILSSKNKSIHTELFLKIKNVKKSLQKELPFQQIGIKAPTKFEIIFEFETRDSEFVYKLALPVLSPTFQNDYPDKANAHKLISNGPYKIKKWIPGKEIQLVPNPFYIHKNNKNVDVTIYVIEDDSTALRLYEANKMDFLRRLSSSNVKKFSSQKGFFQVPMARFDYIGFGPSIKDKNLRKALSLSLNYDDLKNILNAKGRPGCPSLPRRLIEDQIPCYEYNPNLARQLMENSLKQKELPKLDIFFSKLGGDDIAKSMEWVQFQWKKNLGLPLELKPQEDGVYLQMLREYPPPIFRKGISLDRPTCLAALEIFEKDNSENYIKLNDVHFSKFLEKLSQASNQDLKRTICTQAIQYLLDEYYIIPLGEIHFSMLQNNRFEGWFINELNFLDLTDLKLNIKK
jgi:oligopeptide transport system substrate-binding protein